MTSLSEVQHFAGKKCVLCYNQVVSVRERTLGAQEQTSHLDLQLTSEHDMKYRAHVVPGLQLNQTIPNFRTLILQAYMIVMLGLKAMCVRSCQWAKYINAHTLVFNQNLKSNLFG